MVGFQNASAAVPDPSWGPPIMQADAARLAFFDARMARFKRQVATLAAVGFVALLAGVVLGPWLPPKVGFYVAFGGFLGALLGPYGWFRTSFAAHRMFGIYEKGIVPPIHYKGGWDPFVPWDEVRLVKVLHFPLAVPSPLGRPERFVLRIEDDRRWPHRIRETDLTTIFGYSEAECLSIKEEVLAAVRFKLPRIAVELPLKASNAHHDSRQGAQ